MKPFFGVSLALYVVCMVLVVGGMFYARSNASIVYGTESAQTNWESWREDVRQNAPTEGMTKREVPKSPEPPALVLMRDYFWSCTIFAIVMCSALYAITIVAIRGSLSKTVIRDDP